jgi:UPF0755 protein
MSSPSVRSFIRSVLVLAVFLGGFFGGGLYWYSHILNVSGPHQSEVLLVVDPGDGHAVIRAKLARHGVVHQMYHYDAARLIAGTGFLPKAGEFLLPAKASLSQVMAVIHQGYSYQRRLTVVEGLRSADIAVLLDGLPHLSGVLDGVPEEGSLLPDTYFYTHGTPREAVVARMQQARQMALAEAWINRAPGLPYKTPEDALIVASIIEKEAADADDRRLVAAVFVNRLRRSMPLQSDPTVLYEDAVTPDPLPVISRRDLQTKTPWNTYVIKGLPKTPICNPGHESVDAALHPADSDYLYFVSDGIGGLRFAKTLDAHNRNVRLFRKTQAVSKKGQRHD